MLERRFFFSNNITKTNFKGKVKSILVVLIENYKIYNISKLYSLFLFCFKFLPTTISTLTQKVGIEKLTTESFLKKIRSSESSENVDPLRNLINIYPYFDDVIPEKYVMFFLFITEQNFLVNETS